MKQLHLRRLAGKNFYIILSCLLTLAMLVSVMTPLSAGTDYLSGETTEAGSSSGVIYSRTFTINSDQVPSVQTDFPLLISLTDATLKNTADGGHVSQSDGSDLYFTDSSGATQFDYEIESYDAGSGTLTAWVKVPSLETGTAVRMWYGGDSVSHDSAAVWSNNYRAVWHMTEADAVDSTGNGNNGVASVDTTYCSNAPAISNTTGKIGTAQYFDPGATYIDAGAGNSLNFWSAGDYSWGTWINPDEYHSGGSGLIGKGSGEDYVGYDIYLAGKGGIRFQTTSGSTGSANMMTGSAAATGEWTYVAAVYSGGAVTLYYNGQPDVSGTLTTTDDIASSLYLGWKRNSPTQGEEYAHFTGKMDEVQYSGTARSAGWILAQYNNQNDPAAFYTVGEEQSNSAGDLDHIVISPANPIVEKEGQVNFSARAHDSANVPLSGIAFTWACGDAAAGSIDSASGLFTAGTQSGLYSSAVSASSGSVIGFTSVKISSGTLYVDAAGSSDYTSIQAAVEAAAEGNTIIVMDGTYSENVFIDKSLNLQAENDLGAVINPSAGNIVTVSAPEVTIDGFTLTQSDSSSSTAIYVDGAYEHNVFTDNAISGVCNGIFIVHGDNNTISNNSIALSLSGASSYGLRIVNSSGNTISNNNIDDPYNGSSVSYGISLEYDDELDADEVESCSGNTVSDNTIRATYRGLNLQAATDNIFSGNTCISNEFSLRLWPGVWDSTGNVFYLNSFVNALAQNTESGSSSGNSWISPSVMSYWYDGTEYNSYLGNYWGAYYSGEDADSNGIGDTSYTPSALDADSYPLMYRGSGYSGITASPTADFSSNVQKGKLPSCNISFIDLSSGSVPLTYLWDFGDGATSAEQNPVHGYSAAGTYSVTLNVSNAFGTDSLTRTDYITVREEGPWLVDCQGNGDFLTIQEAVDASADGDTIIVMNGTYRENVIVDKSVSIQAETTHGATVMPVSERNSIFAVETDNVEIDGFVLTGHSTFRVYGINGEDGNYGTYTNNRISLVNTGIKMGNYSTATNNTVLTNGYGLIDSIAEGDSNDYSGITNGGAGILIDSGTYGCTVNFNTLSGSATSSTSAGIMVFTVSGSTLGCARDNIVYGNDIQSNTWGIYIQQSSYNTFYGNTLTGNEYGMFFRQNGTYTVTTGNEFYLNTIADNSLGNLYFYDSNGNTENLWNSPQEITYVYNGSVYTGLAGNYWDDYVGEDADGDGIGDSAFETQPTVPEYDGYPLIAASSSYVLGGTESPAADFMSSRVLGTAPLTVYFTSLSSGSEPLTYSWDFNNDGIADSTLQNAAYTFTEGGEYSVSLTVSNDLGSDSEIKTDLIYVKEAGVPWYVDAAGAGHTDSIQTAINSAVYGETIIVRDGTYNESIAVGNGLIVQSENGNTAVNVTGSCTISSSYVTVDGFTFAGSIVMGSHHNPGYNGVTIANNMVTNGSINLYCSWNCTIINNNSPGLYMAGTFNSSSPSSNNTISGNTFHDTTYGIELFQSDDNTFTNNLCLNNTWAVTLNSSTGNVLYLNSFIGSVEDDYAPSTYECTNSWVSPSEVIYGYAGGQRSGLVGNYWSDYQGTDADDDGIGDSTYLLSAKNSDLYPLLYPVNSYTETAVEPTAAFTADPVSGNAGFLASFTNYSSGSAPLAYTWDFDNDGVIDSTLANPSFRYENEGTYTVRLEVTNAAGTATATETDYISVSPGGCYVDASGNGDYTTIQAAVDAASEGETIFVRDGEYPENVAVSKSLTILSENSGGAIVNPASGNTFTVTASGVTIDGFSISNSFSGAGIYLNGAYDDCIFQNNLISNVKYGLYLYNSSNHNLVDNNTVSDVSYYGIRLSTTSSTTISNNTVDLGGYGGSRCMYIYKSSDNLIYNNILTDNYQQQSSFCMYINSSCSNNLIYGNTLEKAAYGMYFTSSSTGNVLYKNNFIDLSVEEVNSSSLEGNTWNSPEVMNYWYNGTQYSSYLGNYWESYAGDDPDGDGIGNTSQSVIGADMDAYPLMWNEAMYSGTLSRPEPDFSSNRRDGHAPLTVTFVDRSAAGTPPLTYSWDFDNDGVEDSTEQNPSYTYTTPGTYSVSLTVANTEGGGTITKTDFIEVLDEGPWVVDASGAGEFTTIQAAVNAAFNGDTILVRDGLYQENVSISKGVSLVSENGNAGVTVNPASGTAFTLTAPDVTIDGFTIITATASNYGVSISSACSDCVIKNNVISGACYSVGGYGKNITVDNNILYPGPGGTYSAGLRISENASAYTVTDNTIDLTDGGLNCIWIMNAGQHTISGNTLKDPAGSSSTFGINLQNCTSGTSVTNITVSGNTIDGLGTGIYLYGARYNTITGNTFYNNYKAIFLNSTATTYGAAAYNLFYLNTFSHTLSSLVTASGESPNYWNSQSELEYYYNGVQYTGYVGNCWDNWYSGEDSDGNGIGDSALAVNSNPEEYDSYPLMYRADSYAAGDTAPTACFTSDLDSGIAGFSVSYSAQRSSGSAPFSLAWDFDGDAVIDSTEMYPVFAYNAAGNYTVSLTVTNAAGSDTLSVTDYVHVDPPITPIADFTVDNQADYAGFTAQFTDLTATGSPPLYYEWDFDNDGTVDSTEQNPAYAYNTAGNFTVSLTISNLGGSSTETKENYITVYPPVSPVADFSADRQLGHLPLTVNFTDQTATGSAPLYYAWDFDNDTVIDSTEQNPSWTYTQAGLYPVSLTVTNLGGSYTETKTGFIDARVVGPWVVDASGNGEFTSIQAAIDTAITGETIQVREGQYPENLVINKQLTLQSVNGNTGTIINPAEGDIITVQAAGVIIDGFSLYQATTSTNCGIKLSTYTGCTFTNNAISGIGTGIYLYYNAKGALGSNTITNNTITLSNVGTCGLYLFMASSNTISGNTIQDPYGRDSTCGMWFGKEGGPRWVCTSNVVTGNTLKNLAYGVSLNPSSNGYASSGNTFYGNNFINSTVANVYPGSNTGNSWSSSTEQTYYYNGVEYTGYVGNFWGSAYSGADANADGIGDSVNEVLSSEYDNYPLMLTNPTVDFTSDVQDGSAPLTVQFSSLSSGLTPMTYAWDFDNDGSVDSTDQNPAYTYTTAGSHSVKLTVSSPGSAETTRTDYITTIYTITVNAGEHGTASATGVFTVNEGDSPAYSFSADTGYHAVVLLDGAPVSLTDGTYTFDPITASHTLDVTFTPDVSITVSIDEAAAYQGDFTARILIDAVTDFNVATYSLNFDPDRLRLDGLDEGAIGDSVVPLAFNQTDNGTFKLVNDMNLAATGISGSGTLAVLHFHVLGEAGQSLSIALSAGTVASNVATSIPTAWQAASISIIKAEQTLTFAEMSKKGRYADPFVISATASSGLPATYQASGNCSISGDIVTITGCGECTITAGQSGNSNYNPAPDTDYTFTVYAAGDANGSGDINALDITQTIRIILELDPDNDLDDADGNGIIDALDIALIEMIILNSY